jgi:hypothetical protein
MLPNRAILYLSAFNLNLETGMDDTRIRPKGDPSLGWAYRPDTDTVAALTRGRSKLAKSNFTLGFGKPHMGGSGSLKDALEAARAKPKAHRRKKVAKRVQASKKRTSVKRTEVGKLTAKSKKKTIQAKPVSKKKTVEAKSNGKLIPLKKICADMDLDPKATRVKLRRMIANEEITFHDHSARWEFTPAQAKEIRAALGE